MAGLVSLRSYRHHSTTHVIATFQYMIWCVAALRSGVAGALTEIIARYKADQ
jgi:hypothetical protein